MLVSQVHQCACAVCQRQEDHPDQAIHHQINVLMSRLDEQQRRWYAALEAQRMGHGGLVKICQITGLSEPTIRRGRAELEEDLQGRPLDRIRLPGAGRPKTEDTQPEIEQVLVNLVEDEIAGDPQSGERWIRKSLSKLRGGLLKQGYLVGRETIRRLLHRQDIRPKSNRKRLVAKPHPDRDLQFQYIQTQRKAFQAMGWPIISVDTKKKELIGSFRNPGQVWCQQAPSVYMHDFPGDAQGKAVPYGIYDLLHHQGYVCVGQSAETPEFAVDAIVHWWEQVGCKLYADAPELLILADGGGANGCRSRRWKQRLQTQLVDAFDLTVTVCHYPTGASKWNPVEHRLFSEITKAWAGTPLTSFEVLLDGIGSTTTATGLQVRAVRIQKTYQKGQKVSDEEMKTLVIEKHATCPNWNYTIRPRKPKSNS